MAYKQRLLAYPPTTSGSGSNIQSVSRPPANTKATVRVTAPAPTPNPSPSDAAAIHPNNGRLPSYPVGCLAFVKHVHPETNKTTLRDLFSVAFAGQPSQSGQGTQIDYVDFQKGMDSVSPSVPLSTVLVPTPSCSATFDFRILPVQPSLRITSARIQLLKQPGWTREASQQRTLVRPKSSLSKW